MALNSLGGRTEKFRPDPIAGQAVAASSARAQDGPPVIGYLGRFVPEKGWNCLHESYSS